MIKETLVYSDYIVWEEKKSMIDPDKKIKVEIGLKCPHCKMELPYLGHNEQSDCYKCGISFIRYGNALECLKHSQELKGENQ